MALNQMIAQGAQFNVPDPVAQYAKMQQLQAVQNQNALAQYQLGSAQRGDAQQNALYARLKDPTFNQDNPQDLASLSQFGTPGIAAMKAITDAANARQTGQKVAGEMRDQQRKELYQIVGDLSSTPTDEKILKSKKIIEESTYYSPEVKQQALNLFDSALSMPLQERKTYFSGQGSTAGERMTASTALAGQDVTRRGQDITAATAKAGQNVTMRGQNLVDAREQQNIRIRQEGLGGKPLTAAQEIKRRDTLGKEFKSATSALQTTQDVLDSITFVKSEPGLSRATGFTGMLPSFPEGGAASADVRLANLKGKVTALGKAAAASSGAIGSIANQEWKILSDQIANIDPVKGTGPLTSQLDLVEQQAQGAMARIQDAYQRQFGEDFDRFPQFSDLPPPKSAIKPKTPAPAAAPQGTGGFKYLGPERK